MTRGAAALLIAFALVLGSTGRSDAASIGGPFTLVDHTGRTVTEEDFRGAFMLVYFGYATCPDVCPTELLVMGQAIDELGEDGARVQPVFITVDPARDTVERLADYVPQFHPRLLGLTGSVEQTTAAAKAFRIYFRLVDADDSAEYLVEHTSYVYLMSPDGEYVTHFAFGQGPEKMAETIREHL